MECFFFSSCKTLIADNRLILPELVTIMLNANSNFYFKLYRLFKKENTIGLSVSIAFKIVNES